MKPLPDQTILVTGATDGIGRGTAAALARQGAHVILHGRDRDKLAAVRDVIAAETESDKLQTYSADFASLAEVRYLGEALARDQERIDVLINNAGIGRGGKGEEQRTLSIDGIELRFQVNHLAPFLLAHLLLPCLKAAAPARIVNVASAAQTAIDFDDVMLETGYSGMRAYSQSKLAMVMATFELAARLDPAEVTVNALHPGSLLDTKMVREGFGPPMGPVETGIEAATYLATSPDLEGVTGQYFDETRKARAHKQAYDDQARKDLWALSERWLAPFLSAVVT